jgi:hypothetical protein
MSHAFGQRILAWLGVLTLSLGVALPLASAQTNKTYKRLVIESFDVPDGANFPADFAIALRDNLVHQLEKTKRFESVTFVDKGQPVPNDADLVLTGNIVKFDLGNRAARYILPGSGMTKIKAEVTFSDPQKSQPLLQREVSGKVVIGAFGGDSKGATNGLAKDVAKAARKDLP